MLQLEKLTVFSLLRRGSLNMALVLRSVHLLLKIALVISMHQSRGLQGSMFPHLTLPDLFFQCRFETYWIVISLLDRLGIETKKFNATCSYGFKVNY
ncbi:hypothetical protein HanRHA438_Chr05g0224731 [Helianthus annuus]|nr:hypothetical protein HanRHA438_Chr05g0224731 [Helianthus annuus]